MTPCQLYRRPRALYNSGVIRGYHGPLGVVCLICKLRGSHSDHPGYRNKMSEISWATESLRATAFHNIGETPKDVTQLWELVRHRSPEQVSSRPAEGLHVAEGSFGDSGAKLQCSIRPDRVDWTLRPAPLPPTAPPGNLIMVGPFEARLPPFRDLCKTWLSVSPRITRLAFGAVLLIETTSLHEAHEQLDALLPSVSLATEDVSDFFYQINRRKTLSSAPGGLVNRLGKWSTIQGGSVQFSLGGNAVPQVSQSMDHFACRLELDINTASVPANPLSGGEAIELFSELVDLGKEMAEKGDIP